MQTGQFTVKIINSDTKPTETARGARVVHILHWPSVQNHVPRSSNLVRKIRNAHMSQNRAKKSAPESRVAFAFVTLYYNRTPTKFIRICMGLRTIVDPSI